MIGIIVLNFRTPKDSYNCIESIKEHTKNDYHIYLVDNCSGDNSMFLFKKWYQGDSSITILESNENRGYSAGNNIGIRAAVEDNIDTLCIMNSDIVLVNPAIDNMYHFLINNAQIGWVGPRIYNEESVEIEDARFKLTLKSHVLSYKPFSYLQVFRRIAKKNRIIDINFYNGVFEFWGAISGCCFLVKSDTMKQCNLFDENVFLYGEEDILAYKLEKLGLKTAILENAEIIHKCGSSTKGDASAFGRYHKRMSSLYVIRAYGNTSDFKYKLYIKFNRFLWKMLAINNIEYRSYLELFDNQLDQYVQIKQGQEIKKCRR